MKLIDNVNERLKDDLENEIKTNSKVEIAAASFSIYAFKELKEQWTDLIIETQRLKLDYDRLVHELEDAKDVLINVHYGNTWRYKLAKWLIK